MPLPELIRKLVESKLSDYCDNKVPFHVRDRVRLTYKIRGNMVTLLEERPRWDAPEDSEWVKSKVAQFRFDPENKQWSLYWRDRNGKWHPYTQLRPMDNIEHLIAEVDNDPTGIF